MMSYLGVKKFAIHNFSDMATSFKMTHRNTFCMMVLDYTHNCKTFYSCVFVYTSKCLRATEDLNE